MGSDGAMGAWTGSAVCVCVWISTGSGRLPVLFASFRFRLPSETIRAALIAALAVRFGKSLILLPHLVSASPHLEAGNSHMYLVQSAVYPKGYRCTVQINFTFVKFIVVRTTWLGNVRIKPIIKPVINLYDSDDGDFLR